MDFYEKNLKFFKKRCPHLIRPLSRKGHSGIEIFETREGKPSCRIMDRDGVKVALHSLEAPQREAEEQIEALSSKMKDKEVIVLLGIGLGYQLLELLKRVSDRQFIIAVERRPDFFIYALTFHDWSDLLKVHRVEFIVGEEDIKKTSWKLKRYIGNGKSMHFLHNNSLKIDRAYYSQIWRIKKAYDK